MPQKLAEKTAVFDSKRKIYIVDCRSFWHSYPERFGCMLAGFDTLTLVGRSLFAVCRRLSQSGRVVPGVMSRSTEAAEGGTRDEVSLDVEDVVNGGVDGDEALG